MKSTGIVRKVDQLGRIVVPKELITTLNINAKDELEFCIDNENIVMKKRESACVFCSRMKDTFSFKGRSVCKECMAKIAARLKE
jgi:transcriptional pleiotropic regulator of transition state genes